MPLVKPETYTWREALDLVKKACPDENPAAVLRDACSVPFSEAPLTLYIRDQQSGEMVKVPSDKLLSNDFTIQFKRGMARWLVRGHVQGIVINGPVYFKRGQLDALLNGVNTDRKTDLGDQRSRKEVTSKRDAGLQKVANLIFYANPEATILDAAQMIVEAAEHEHLVVNHRSKDGKKLTADRVARIIQKPKN